MKKILIVDDQPAVRELITVAFEIEPYQLLTAENGDQALSMAQTELPDLMLLDIQMPGGSLDGLQVCQRLKNDPLTKHIHIIILTAKGQVWDQQAGQEVGADDYLIKPVSLLHLMNKVKTVLNVAVP